MNNEIAAYVADKEQVSRDELVGLFGDKYKVPSYETLSHRYISARIAVQLSAARDDKSRRLILAARDENGIQYVFIPSCDNPVTLKNIRERIVYDIHGQEASLEKVDARMTEIGCDPEAEIT
jgi:hypothetical protein